MLLSSLFRVRFARALHYTRYRGTAPVYRQGVQGRSKPAAGTQEPSPCPCCKRTRRAGHVLLNTRFAPCSIMGKGRRVGGSVRRFLAQFREVFVGESA
jgi:hypothetical protein